MCRVLQVSHAGYYKWLERGPSQRAQQDERLRALIGQIHAQSRKTYGAPRIHAELREAWGVRCSRKRVARLMRELELQGVCRRRCYGCTKRDPSQEPYPDLVQREFRVTAPNRLWVTDITQHPTREGWLYHAVVLDVYSKMVVGWSMGERAEAQMVLAAVNMAILRRRPVAGLRLHSDHGSQFTSLIYGQRLEEARIMGSMGKVGDALDNAVAESYFATLQAELLDTRNWMTREQLRSAIFEYTEVFYNRQRRHSSLNYLSPLEFEFRSRIEVQVANN